MSKEVIEILEYISDKLGIAIDWTSDNVWPQVLDALTRYSHYEIVSSIVVMVLCISIMTICLKLLLTIAKDYGHKRESLFCSGSYMSDFGIIASIVSCIVFIVAFIVCAVFCSKLLKWFFIPEIQILELLKSYMSSH